MGYSGCSKILVWCDDPDHVPVGPVKVEAESREECLKEARSRGWEIRQYVKSAGNGNGVATCPTCVLRKHREELASQGKEVFHAQGIAS